MPIVPDRISKAAFKRALAGRESLFLLGGAPALLDVPAMERALAGALALEAERRVGRVASNGIRFERADGTSSFLGIGKRDDCYAYGLAEGTVYCCAETFEDWNGKEHVNACYYYVPGGAGGREE